MNSKGIVGHRHACLSPSTGDELRLHLSPAPAVFSVSVVEAAKDADLIEAGR